jgi:transcriptional regulator with XRE-family HTH domain
MEILMSKSSLAIAALPIKLKSDLCLLGQRLKLARKKRKMTIKGLSQDLGFSSFIISKIENGEPSIPFAKIIKLLTYLNLNSQLNEFLQTTMESDDKFSLIEKKRLQDHPLLLSMGNLGQAVKKLRKSRKISIDRMASCIFASPVTIKKLEKGRPSISIGMIAAVLFFFRLEAQIEILARPENDKIGLSLDFQKLIKRPAPKGI